MYIDFYHFIMCNIWIGHLYMLNMYPGIQPQILVLYQLILNLRPHFTPDRQHVLYILTQECPQSHRHKPMCWGFPLSIKKYHLYVVSIFFEVKKNLCRHKSGENVKLDTSQHIQNILPGQIFTSLEVSNRAILPFPLQAL